MSETTATPQPTPASPLTLTSAAAGQLEDPAAIAESASAATKEENPEPQNQLTQHFTESEWQALREFRSKLPEIQAKAYSDSKTGIKSIVLWGVELSPSKPDARASVVLMKFLRARNLSVTDASDMLVATLHWRDEFNVDAALKEEYPEDVFGNLGHIYGHDKEGRPVVYNIYGGNNDLKVVFSDVQRFVRWRVALMEKSVQLLDFVSLDQTVQVHDYEGVSLRSRDVNSKNATVEATNIFQNHYPELLYKKFFVNVPSYLAWIFWIVKPLLSAKTVAKMSVVGTGSHAIGKELLPIVDAKELPKRYGGDAEGF